MVVVVVAGHVIKHHLGDGELAKTILLDDGQSTEGPVTVQGTHDGDGGFFAATMRALAAS